jgi:hypothetical protein
MEKKTIEMPEEIYEIEGDFRYRLELTDTKYTARYNSDLSHQTACFIVVKNVIDKLIADRINDKSFKKEKAFFQKMSYNLNEFIGGQSSVLIERVIEQTASDLNKKKADDLGITIVKNMDELKS